MTAPVRDDAGRFTTDHGPLPDIARTPRNGFQLRYDAAAERARRALAEALAALRPQVPPCTLNPDAWYPNDRHTAAGVAKAIEACGRCPLIGPCRTVGRHESWGVWGGEDRDQTRRASREWKARQDVPRAQPARDAPRAPRRGKWRARPLPIVCPFCKVAAHVNCITDTGSAAERNHSARLRDAARAAAA